MGIAPVTVLKRHAPTSEWRRLLSQGAVYAFGALISRVVSLVMLPLYTRALSPAEYGIVDLLDTTAAVIANVSGVAITYSVMRFYFKFDTAAERNRVISTGMLGLVCAGVVGAVCFWPIAPSLSVALFHSTAYSLALRLMAITALLYGLIEVPMTYMRALELPGAFLVVSLGRLVLGVILNVVLVVTLRRGVMGVVCANLGTSIVAVVGVSLFTLPRTGVSLSPRLLRGMVGFGIPLIPGAVAMLVLHNGDRYILNRFRPLDEVGIYSLGYKLGMILTYAVSVPFGNVWSARMYSVMREPDGIRTYTKVSMYFVFAMLAAWLGLSAISRELVRVGAGPEFAAAAIFVPIIAGGYLFREISEYWKNAFLIADRTRTLVWIQPVTAVLNVVLTWVMVQRWGALGAAWATVATFVVLLAITVVLAERVLPTQVSWRAIAVAAAAASGLLWVCGFVPTSHVAYALMLKIGIVLMFPGAIVAFRALPPDDASALWQHIRGIRSRPARVRTGVGGSIAP